MSRKRGGDFDDMKGGMKSRRLGDSSSSYYPMPMGMGLGGMDMSSLGMNMNMGYGMGMGMDMNNMLGLRGMMGGGATAGTGSGISTVYISGLPDDIQEREIRNLCRFLPGYEGSRIARNKFVVGFVKFASPMYAAQAVSALSDYVFDPQNPSKKLRASMANREMTVHRESTENTNTNFFPYYSGQLFNPYPSLQGMTDDVRGGGSSRGYGGSSDRYGGRSRSSRDRGIRPDSLPGSRIDCKKSGSDCDTLCVRYLGPWCTRQDVESIFSNLPGFEACNYLNSKGLGFIKFEKESDARDALNEVDGKFMNNCDGKTHVVVEYAKRSLEISNEARGKDRRRD